MFLLLAVAVPFLLPAQSNMSSSDSKFVTEAASGGMTEVKLGHLAERNGNATAVKDFGHRMVADHTKAGNELKDVADKENFPLPTAMSAADRATYEKLSKLQGAEFDKAYADAMVRDHEKDVAEFDRESRTGENDGVKAFAARTLPTLKDHLRQAREMLKTVASS